MQVAFLLGVVGHTCGSRPTVNFLNGFVGRNETTNQRLFFIDVVQTHSDIYIKRLQVPQRGKFFFS